MGENNPLHKDYLPPHYKEEYRLAIDALLESDTSGYHDFLRTADVVSFLAQPEIEFIKSTVQLPTQTTGYPELTNNEGLNDVDGSSDTYWPMHSDVAAPGLDLGWPTIPITGIGATEVTTLVNPSDPDMPSIKEQARRLIKNARHVIAIVMDMFTDVDIFADLLDATARHVPVYILLDEHDSHHFVSMVMNCKVNLDLIHMMRVRSVPGITYYSRSGKTFKGQVKDRFLLVDCRAVLSGSYSFMWSYEKIHRCIAHLFLGDLVASFDEEFRILYAQSEPLVIDPSLAVPDTSNYLSNQFGLKRSQSLRNPIGFRRQPDLPSAFPYGDNLALPFRRNDPFRHTMEPGTGVTIGKYSQQQFRPQQSYIDQGRSIVSRPADISGTTFKRHSYAEGTQENYTSSRQYMKHRVMNNLDETDFHREPNQSSHYYTEGPGPGSGHGHYDRLRGYPSHLSIDQHSDSSFRSDRGPTGGNYGRPHFSSEDLTVPEGFLPPPVAGRYDGGSGHKRPTIGQPYTCLASPTQTHSPAKKPFSYDRLEPDPEQDENAKQGLRNYRLSSYLSAYENYVEEGLNQQMGPDAFDDPSQDPTAEGSTHFFGKRDPPTVPSKPRPDILKPRFGKPVPHDSSNYDSSLSKTTLDLLPSASILEKREREAEKERERDGIREVGVDVGVKEAPELLLSKHESFRSRINPQLQRSSRLRSSLIFSSSKAEMHSGSLGMKPATEEDDELDLGRTTSIVSQILEKRRSITREPFQWRKKTEEKIQETEQEKPEKVEEKDERPPDKVTLEKDEMKSKMEHQKPKEEVKSATTLKATEDVSTLPTVNMNDPASRLQYFKELAAKRKVTKTETDSKLRATEPMEIKSEEAKEPPKPQHTTAKSSVTNGSTEPERKKPDIASKLAELEKKETHGSSKPPLIPSKPQLSYLKPLEASQTHKEESSSDGHKKDIFKSLKPLPSPKIFKKDPLKLKGLNPRRSCGEEILTGDATDAEKSEMKKIRSHSSSTLPRENTKELKGSNTSINTLGNDGKSEGKTLDFLKKQTQKLKGMLGTKDKDKKSSGEDRGMSSVKELVEDFNKKQSSTTKETVSAPTEQATANHKSTTPTTAPTRYQSPTSSVIFSSNLRDDTKVILEQISANSQKNRQDREQETGADRESDSGDKGLERQNSIKRSRFLRPIGSVQEREGLLKRIESLRKEKKVYSRFEMGNSLG